MEWMNVAWFFVWHEDLNKKAKNREVAIAGGEMKRKKKADKRWKKSERSVAEHEGGEEGTCREWQVIFRSRAPSRRVRPPLDRLQPLRVRSKDHRAILTPPFWTGSFRYLVRRIPPRNNAPMPISNLISIWGMLLAPWTSFYTSFLSVHVCNEATNGSQILGMSRHGNKLLQIISSLVY